MFIAFSFVRSHNSMTGAMDASVQKTVIEVEKRTSLASSPLPGAGGLMLDANDFQRRSRRR